MNIFRKITYLSLVIFIGCSSSKSNNSFYAENQKVNLYAFIGEKISIEEFDPNKNNRDTLGYDSIQKGYLVRISMVSDKAFKCKYKIESKVFNNLQTDTIEFLAYDHYGRPGFENYEKVILYISKTEDGKNYFHQKYQYDPLFQDVQGNYYGYFDFRNEGDVLVNSKLKSFKIDFDESQNIDVSEYNEYMLASYVPQPFYEITNVWARPVVGARIAELFQSKKEIVFKKLFENN